MAIRARAGAAPLKLAMVIDALDGTIRARAGAAPLKPVQSMPSFEFLPVPSAPARARPR